MSFKIILISTFVTGLIAAQPAIDLPQPTRKGGKPLMEALAERKSSREFASTKLPLDKLSNLLWAAYGVNRPASGSRTAPSAHNRQTVDLYVAIPEGLYLYDAAKHRLQPVASEDARAISGTQDFVAKAPLNLVFVAQMNKLERPEGVTDADAHEWVAVEAGAIAQNVYLYCASEGLATVVRAGVQREAFTKLAKLPADRRILSGQTVGYPAP